MNLLYNVLHKIEGNDGPVSINDIARELNVDASAVEGMISFWVNKGRLKRIGGTACVPSGCSTCSMVKGQTGCPFTISGPNGYELRK